MMITSNSSGWMMVAILKSQVGHRGGFQDNALIFPAIMLIKLWLNAFVLKFCSRSLWRSFMGISGVSLCLSDTLLIFAMAVTWLLQSHVEVHVSLCFALSHASTVYSLLPLPFLLLGALDCASELSPRARAMSPCRAFAYCLLVLSTWVLASLYSYRYTYSQVMKVENAEHGESMLLCLVQRSSAIPYFCVVLCLAIFCVLLLHCQREPWHWNAAVASSWRWVMASFAPHSGLPIGHVKPQGVQAAELEGRPAPPLLLRLTLRFAFTWAPFLLLNVGCMLVGIAVPSYMGVNFVWLLCAHSFLVGATFWLQGGQPGPGGELPEDICMWSFNHHQTDGGEGLGFQENAYDGTPSTCDTERLLLP